MKSVLIVTPYFAPQSHAAVFRAHKLAKYLPEHGWKPYVLTVDTNYLYNEDPGLLAELPEEVEIVRARYVEPTVRGVRMALGGEDRTFVAQKASLLRHRDPGQQEGTTPAALQRALGARVYGYARRRWLIAPDAYWTWERPAIRAGRELIERHGIDVVYTTAMPFTAHRIGRALQQLGPRWVADFRDPTGYAAKVSSPSGRVRARQYDIVHDTLLHADFVTATSSSYGLIFNDIHGDITKRPVRFLPTGADDELIPSDVRTNVEEPYIVYVGEVMPEQTDEFFAVLAGAMHRDRGRHRLVVVGHEILNRRRLTSVLDRYGLGSRVEFIDHSPQADVYRLIAGARAGVLAPGRTSYWWNNHAKLVDYVALRKPVLAVVPDPSEARSVLTRTNLGVFLDGDDERAMQTLTAFLNGEIAPLDPVVEECDRYLASSQVQSFIDVFQSLM